MRSEVRLWPYQPFFSWQEKNEEAFVVRAKLLASEDATSIPCLMADCQALDTLFPHNGTFGEPARRGTGERRAHAGRGTRCARVWWRSPWARFQPPARGRVLFFQQ